MWRGHWLEILLLLSILVAESVSAKNKDRKKHKKQSRPHEDRVHFGYIDSERRTPDMEDMADEPIRQRPFVQVRNVKEKDVLTGGKVALQKTGHTKLYTLEQEAMAAKGCHEDRKETLTSTTYARTFDGFSSIGCSSDQTGETNRDGLHDVRSYCEDLEANPLPVYCREPANGSDKRVDCTTVRRGFGNSSCNDSKIGRDRKPKKAGQGTYDYTEETDQCVIS